MPFADMRATVFALSPTQLDDTSAAPGNVASIINDAYQQFLRYRPWLEKTRYTPIISPAVFTAGTVSVTQGAAIVTGVGTGWTSALVGRYFKIGQRAWYRIVAFTSGTSISLEKAWEDTSLSAQKYEIAGLRFLLPSDAERVIRLNGKNWPVFGQTPWLVDFNDPLRIIHGSPIVYNESTIVFGGIREIEWWPVPSVSETFMLVYLAKIPKLVAPSDTTLLDEDTIVQLAKAEACRRLYSRTGDSVWSELSNTYQGLYAEMRDMLVRDDRRKRRPLMQALDSDDVPNYTDPAWNSAFRTIQSLAQQSLA